MLIDTSALMAIILKEPEADSFIERLQGAQHRYTSPLVVLEAVMRLSSLLDAGVPEIKTFVGKVLAEAGVEVVPINARMADLAVEAFDRFGKGRHPARLNLADCMSYAAAKAYRTPLLYKGEDFSKTDLA
ncbi:type II toxin-antitoxin system VapC family toxin [Phenylobacterium montanum]|uniref:Ribonuclease VapC n=1 Tax=Phenylobacterium montanum TaxID=2823693 RepID=A0A975IWI9_9CAUL|nr:type II toxin-antitoxin system VapC family toxin [Caulobacter sp. S6]QUD89928.1 type II toxin-antitoxin system VapC family toxin [Caulobacter sp. S6]